MRVRLEKPWAIYSPGEWAELDPPIVEILQDRGIVARGNEDSGGGAATPPPREAAAVESEERADVPHQPRRRRPK
jgi:hypothetical protein